MNIKITTFITQIIVFLFVYSTILNAAFDGNYLFQLEAGTQTEINNIITPQTGMMVYNTTTNKINYYDGTAWIVLSGESIYNSDGQLTSNRNVDLNTYTLAYINGNVGIGNLVPNATLDVNGSLRVDGIYYDKDGDVGTLGQILTSNAIGTDWTSSALAPNISNSTIIVTAASTVTITLNGDNFIPSSSVTIPGFDGTVNSVNAISPIEIQVNITTGSANTFDILVSNNGILNTQWVGNGVGLLQVN